MQTQRIVSKVFYILELIYTKPFKFDDLDQKDKQTEWNVCFIDTDTEKSLVFSNLLRSLIFGMSKQYMGSKQLQF